MNQIFKLPIEYDKYKKNISQKLNDDLELNRSYSIYHLNPDNFYLSSR